MLAIQKAIQDIEFEIPSKILELAFLSDISKTHILRPTLEEQIEKVLIKPKVLTDCNIVGGTTITIPVEQCYQELVPYNPTGNYMVIYVPPELRDNKDILSALSLTYSLYTPPGAYGINTNPGLKLTERAFNAVDANVGGFATSNLELIGPNTILVHETIYSNIGGYLRVKVENDDELRNLNPRYFLHFSKLCILATKGYCYNKLIIGLNEGYVYGGHELNKITEIVESYSDAWEEYREYLNTVWRKLSFMNDDQSHSRFIKAMINPIL